MPLIYQSMSEWERVGLRVHADQLARWEAVCKPSNPDEPDDALVNVLPHLYDTKSNLIRQAVSELITRETNGTEHTNAEVNVNTDEIEETVELVRNDTRELLDRVRTMENRQEEIYTEQVNTADDIAAEVYQELPNFTYDDDLKESVRNYIEQIDRDWDIILEEGRNYGYLHDLLNYFEGRYSVGTVLDALETLREDVDEVRSVTIDGKMFYMVVDEDE